MVDGLYIDEETENFNKEGIRLKVIGSQKKLPKPVLKKIKNVEKLTRNNSRITIQIALSYGSREELTKATQEIAHRVLSGELHPEDIEEQTINNHLYTAGIPDPDLLIRTSGEMRLSNFLLWQLSYAEFYITDVLWPDFDEKELHNALNAYNTRQRRYGKVNVS